MGKELRITPQQLSNEYNEGLGPTSVPNILVTPAKRGSTFKQLPLRNEIPLILRAVPPDDFKIILDIS